MMTLEQVILLVLVDVTWRAMSWSRVEFRTLMPSVCAVDRIQTRLSLEL